MNVVSKNQRGFGEPASENDPLNCRTSVVIVGPPSSQKTVAVRSNTDAFKRGSFSPISIVREDGSVEKVERVLCISGDVTKEALIHYVYQNQNEALIYFPDEIARIMDEDLGSKYHKGMREFWLGIYETPSWSERRKDKNSIDKLTVFVRI